MFYSRLEKEAAPILTQPLSVVGEEWALGAGGGLGEG